MRNDTASLLAALDRRVAGAPHTRVARLTRDPVGVIARKLRARDLVTASTFWGDNLVGIRGETVTATIAVQGYLEEGLTRAFLSLVRPGMSVVDVGAHIGYFTLLAARLVGPKGAVVAYEPTPSTFELLRRNVGERSTIVLRPVAAWDEPGHVDLHDLGPERSAFNSFTTPRGVRPRHVRLAVAAVRLDDDLAALGVQPGLVKVDAESAEWHVVLGLERTLRNVRPVLSLEVGDFGAPGALPSSELLRRVCDDFGYVPREWRDGTLRALRPRDRWGYDNVLLLPTERLDG